ncbi:MAG TPA: YceK/YidQ family lipoprotein [Stellaceae bacterium]
MVQHLCEACRRRRECDPFGAVAYLMLWPVFVVDLPLSMAADTLFLPYTLAASSKADK